MGNQSCHTRVPFGPLIEFRTYPNTQPYRRNTPLQRWTRADSPAKERRLPEPTADQRSRVLRAKLSI